MKKSLLLLLPTLALTQAAVSKEKLPNIIFILADDLGFGDLSSYNENSKINTTHLDAMAESGIAFRDAHTSSGVSTPTRYGVLTGRYNWRSTLKSGVLNGFSKALIPTTRTTMGSLLKRAGYNTAFIGKWHLGWNWNYTEEPKNINTSDSNNKGVIDYSKPVTGGPNELGFDYSYGFCGSLDMAPYTYVENGLATETPDHETVGTGMEYWRKGPTAPNFVHEDAISHITDKSIEYISKVAKSRDPFFLYLPYPAPHTPILPGDEWAGKSGLNPYGDYVLRLDHEVGRLMEYLEKRGLDKNTIVVFTSDNGCSRTAKLEDLAAMGHLANYTFRGMKTDLFEGGHRVPCIVKWGSKLTPGVSNQTICLTDFFATFADIAGLDIADTEGEDSYSLKAVFDNTSYSTPIRKTTIHHGGFGDFAIRVGDWKLITIGSSGGWSSPTRAEKDLLAKLPPMQLYNLADDPSEKNNLYESNPEKVQELLTLLRADITNGRSTAGAPQTNETKGEWTQLKAVFE